MAKSKIEQKLEDLRSHNCSIRDIKSEIVPGKIKYTKSDIRGYGLSDLFDQTVDTEFPYYAPEDGGDKDKTVDIDLQLQLGNQIAFLPAKSIINLELIESQDYLWYFGSVTILDANTYLLNSFRWRGSEGISLNFGHPNLFIPIQLSVTSIDKIETHDKHSVFRINFAHPGWSRGMKYIPYSTPSPAPMSTAVITMMAAMGVALRPNIEPTANIGNYTNHGLDAADYLKWLTTFAISVKGNANYRIFTSFTDWYFVSSDYFNRQALFNLAFSFTDTPNFDQYSDVVKAPLMLASRWGPIDGFIGRAKLGKITGSIHDWKTGLDLSELTSLELKELLLNKTMLGKSYDDLKGTEGVSQVLYTGFREATDERGYLARQADMAIEKTTTGEVVVRGYLVLGARGFLRPGAAINLDIIKGTEENKESLYGGAWIVNSVRHTINQEDGWRATLSIYRNSH